MDGDTALQLVVYSGCRPSARYSFAREAVHKDGSTAGRNCPQAAWHFLPPAASFASGVFFRFVFLLSLPWLPATAALAFFILPRRLARLYSFAPSGGGAFRIRRPQVVVQCLLPTGRASVCLSVWLFVSMSVVVCPVSVCLSVSVSVCLPNYSQLLL